MHHSEITRPADSPVAESIRLIEFAAAGEMLMTPDGCWDIAILKRGDGVRVLSTGLTTRPVAVPHDAGDEIGVHVNAGTLGFIPFGPIPPEELATFTDAEKVRANRLQRFMAEHFGFNAIQSMRPQAVAYALSDSPAGLLAWISDLFTSFGDRPDAIDRDRFLTNFVIYWLTGTAASSIRLYYENAHDPNAWAPKQNSGVPTAVAVFGYDEVPIRRYGERENTIVRWTEFDRGGHYAVIEVPDLWVGDVRASFAAMPGGR